MTFVAHPYERFVDDLLMALTGGTIREEHQFQGVDRPYALGSPGVVVESLRVFGERGGEFALFERDVDYRHDDGEDAIAWLVDGRPPDERTHFYVSYFTGEANQRLTDRNPGSVTTTLAEAFSRQYAVLHKQMHMIYRSAFVELSEGQSLDHVAALFDKQRKDAKFAGGEVMFKRSTPAPGDITIPAGTLVSTPEAQMFETTQERTLRRDQLSVVVPVRAQVEGAPGAVAAGAITVANRPIFGIETVLNERPTFFAAERETDEELRRRIRGSLHRAGRSTLEAIRNSLIEQVPELTEANIQVVERPEAPGAVEVRLGVAGGVDERFVRRVDDAILMSRAAGVRVTHNLGAPAPGPAPAEPAPPPERAEVVAGMQTAGALEPAQALDGAAMPSETVQPLRVEVLLRLVQPNVTAAEREAVETGVRDAVVRYVEALPMGAPLVHAKLLAAIASADEIADASMLVRALGADAPAAEHRGNVVAAGRKLTVDPHEIAVYLMDQRVRLDARVRVQDRPSAGGPPAEVGAPLRAAVQSALEAAVAAGGRSVTREALRAAAAAAVESAAASLILAEHEAVVVNATYEETGRIVSDATEVALQEHEVAVVGTVVVDRVGVLDG